MESTAPASDQVLVERNGPIVTLTFNRPEARNAMTWGMYQRLYEVCEEVDADDGDPRPGAEGRGRKGLCRGH